MYKTAAQLREMTDEELEKLWMDNMSTLYINYASDGRVAYELMEVETEITERDSMSLHNLNLKFTQKKQQHFERIKQNA